MHSDADYVTAINTEPYVIRGTDRVRNPVAMPALIELNAGGDEETLDVTPAEFRFAQGDPAPSRAYRLYDWEADTLMTSGTYDTGAMHYSHPVPIKGYEQVNMSVRADTASATDGLVTEVLTQEENWRPVDTYDLGADEFYYLDVNVDFPLMRVGYEPSADGASITDAEVNLA